MTEITTALARTNISLNLWIKKAALAKKLRKQASELVVSMNGHMKLKKRDQAWVDTAKKTLDASGSVYKDISAVFKKFKQEADLAHKEVIATEAEYLGEMVKVSRLLKTSIADVLDEAEKERQRKQAEIDAKQRELNEQNAKESAKVARSAGADKMAIADIKQSIHETPAPVVAAKIEAPSGTVRSKLWGIDQDDYDLPALVRAAAADPSLMGLLEPNWTALRNRAIEGKEAMLVPGFRSRWKWAGTDQWNPIGESPKAKVKNAE